MDYLMGLQAEYLAQTRVSVGLLGFGRVEHIAGLLVSFN